jgi:malonyl CoA-acyl carrier protein transacylase
MGGALFDQFPQLTREADDILGYSVKELCLEDPRSELNETQFTQPALYVVNALTYFERIRQAGSVPDYLAGHSVGEFNALLAAECFDFATGLQLVRKRGELMSQAGGGAMAAILNATQGEIEALLADGGLTNIDLANYNTPSQIVISGAADEIGKAQFLFKGKMLYYPLNTSGAFHSRFMRAAQDEFHGCLKGFELSDPKRPVISNVTARPYERGEILDNLSRQISSTVRWCEGIQYLLGLATNGSGAMQFEEIGHGDVLTKLVHTIKQQSGVRPKAPAPQSADEKVLHWNQKYPIGTKVRSTMAEYKALVTRTAAVVLFGHRAAVYMSGYNGYFDLDELTPV